jgi:hypothetical protein
MPSEPAILHRALFHTIALPPDLEARYWQARDLYFAADPDAPLVAYIAEHDLDPEAIEYFLRLRRGPNGLTRRFQVVLTLCEVRSAYDPAFVQRTPARGLTWACAPLLPVRAVWKLVRGLILYRTHRLGRFAHV